MADLPGRQPVSRFDAVVLAGGRGSRAGGIDKPGQRVGGRTLLAGVVSAAGSAGAARIIVAGPRRPGVTQFAGPDAGPRPPGPVFVREDPPGPVFVREDPPGPVFVREDPRGPVFVCEDPPGSGPVAALAAALPEVTAPLTLLLAADLPFLTARALAPLPSACDGAPGAVLADDGGRPQWLASCWRTAALRGALAGYRGRSLHGLLEPLRPVLLACPAAPGEPPPWLDCDTAEDLARARRLARGKERHA